jgi:hypothetical protein
MSEQSRTQSYGSHRRYHVWFHFIALPILSINVLATIVQAVRFGSYWTYWDVVVASAVLITLIIARGYALTVQDRVIRLEERIRLQRVLPAELQASVDGLRTRQLVALRFCPDEELPELVRTVVAGEASGPDQIKRRITAWRADWFRV